MTISEVANGVGIAPAKIKMEAHLPANPDTAGMMQAVAHHICEQLSLPSDLIGQIIRDEMFRPVCLEKAKG